MENTTKTINRTIDIQGKKVKIKKSNFYKRYYTKVNHIYITDYKDCKGNVCYRKVEVKPTYVFDGEEKVGTKTEVCNIEN